MGPQQTSSRRALVSQEEMRKLQYFGAREGGTFWPWHSVHPEWSKNKPETGCVFTDTVYHCGSDFSPHLTHGIDSLEEEPEAERG